LHPKLPGEKLLGNVLQGLKLASPLKMTDKSLDDIAAVYSSTVADSLKYLEITAVKTAIISLFSKGYALSIDSDLWESNKLYVMKTYYDANDLKKEILDSIFEDLFVLIENLPPAVELPLEKSLSCLKCGKQFDKTWKICLYDNTPLKAIF